MGNFRQATSSPLASQTPQNLTFLEPKLLSCYTIHSMKADLHPTWYSNAKVTCACGNTFVTGSTLPAIRVEICSNCHPFYTGQQKFVDTLGQVERFQKKTKESEVKREVKQKIIFARSQKQVEEKKEKPSLKDLLMQARKAASS